MPLTYVRFVTTTTDKDSGRRRGIFQAAFDLSDAKELTTSEREEFEELENWFDEHLKAPRLHRFRRRSSDRCGAVRRDNDMKMPDGMGAPGRPVVAKK
jgi:hypothetical protein